MAQRIYWHMIISVVLIGMLSTFTFVNVASAYVGSTDYPELFKYSSQKNANLENALFLISNSFNNYSISITQELLAAMMATLDKEVGKDYLPVEEVGDYGMGQGSTYTVGGSRRSTPYDGGVDYKGRGYIQITLKSNYRKYCPDCVGTSTPELDVCGCKNQRCCTVTDASICPQVKALQPGRAADIFALYYIGSPQGKNLVSLSNAKEYMEVGRAINANEDYVFDFNAKANNYQTLFNNNPEKTVELLTWLNSGTSAAVAATSIGMPVTLTLYVHREDANGPIIPGVLVEGRDGAGNRFEQTTDSNGYVTITGIPGTWSFSASAEGYEANSWDQEIIRDDTNDAFLLEEQQSPGSVSSSEMPTAPATISPGTNSEPVLVHDDDMESISFSPDGSKAATTSWNSYNKHLNSLVWDASSGAELLMLDYVGDVSFSPDGSMIATASSYDNTAIIWDISGGTEKLRLVHDNAVYSVSFSPDGSKVATGSMDGTARIWDSSNGEELQRLVHDGASDITVSSVIFSPDGSKIGTISYDEDTTYTARIWDVFSGAELLKFDYVDKIIFSPDCSKIVTTSVYDISEDRHRDIWIRDASNGNRIYEIFDGEEPVSFSPDGSKIATYDKNSALIWDVSTGTVNRSLYHDGYVVSAAFSPDGSKIATASYDKTARIWDLSSGAELLRLVHDREVESISYCPDGSKVATVSLYDNTVRIWDVSS